jgi:hypothetical protein
VCSCLFGLNGRESIAGESSSFARVAKVDVGNPGAVLRDTGLLSNGTVPAHIALPPDVKDKAHLFRFQWVDPTVSQGLTGTLL